MPVIRRASQVTCVAARRIRDSTSLLPCCTPNVHTRRSRRGMFAAKGRDPHVMRVAAGGDELRSGSVAARPCGPRLCRETPHMRMTTHEEVGACRRARWPMISRRGCLHRAHRGYSRHVHQHLDRGSAGVLSVASAKNIRAIRMLGSLT